MTLSSIEAASEFVHPFEEVQWFCKKKVHVMQHPYSMITADHSAHPKYLFGFYKIATFGFGSSTIGLDKVGG